MLKSTILQNTEIVTAFGKAIFDEKGESTNLTESAQMTLGKTLSYMTFVPDKVEAPKEEKAAPVEEPKEEKEALAKKAPVKKAAKKPAKKAKAKETE